MYNGTGLQSARGSGTTGYTQSNKFFVKSKPTIITTTGNTGDDKIGPKPKIKEIMEHERKRLIELKLVVLEDKLVDHGYTEDEIVEKINQARKKLEAAEVINSTSV